MKLTTLQIKQLQRIAKDVKNMAKNEQDAQDIMRVAIECEYNRKRGIVFSVEEFKHKLENVNEMSVEEYFSEIIDDNTAIGGIRIFFEDIPKKLKRVIGGRNAKRRADSNSNN